MSKDIEINVNSEEAVGELNSIKNAANQLAKTNKSVSVQSVAAMSTITQSLIAVTANYSMLNTTVAITAATIANINTAMTTSVSQMAAVTTSVMTMNAALTQSLMLWSMFNTSIMTNTALLALNMAQVMANVLNETIHNSIIVMQTAAIGLYSSAMMANLTLYNQLTQKVSANTAALIENMSQMTKNVLLSAVNSLAVLLESTMFKNLNEQLEKTNKSFEAINKSCSINSALLLLSAVALMVHKAALSQENKELTSNTTRRTNNNKRTAAGIGLKGFEIGAMFPFPANVAMAPALGAAFTAAAFAICKMGVAALATGGVVSKPTYAMVGEGRYPEAVVPLGGSPQFTQMKNDIANTVLKGLAAMGSLGKKSGDPLVVELVLDGDKFARAVIPAIDKENRRRGYNLQVRRV